MRRRKASNRGRPKKAKKSEKSPLPEQTSPSPPSSPAKSDSCGDEMEKAKAASRSGDESEDHGSIPSAPGGYSRAGPTSYNIGSTYLELAGADDDIHCEFKEADVCLEVECGANKAQMYLSRLCQGSKGQCIQYQNNWLTPNEFQYISGRETAKDWKRSIRHRGRSLKLLISKGILTVHPSACRCESCRYLGEITPSKSTVLKGFPMASKVSPKSHDSSNHSSSDSSKHSVKSQSLDNNSKDSKRRNGKSVDASEEDDDDDDDEEEEEDEEELGNAKKQTETLTVEKVTEAPEEGKPSEAHKSTLKMVISKQKGAVIKKSESSDSDSDSSSSSSSTSSSGSSDSDTEEDIPLSRTVAAKGTKANNEAGPATSSAKSSPRGEATSPKGEAVSPKVPAVEEGSKSPKEEKDKSVLPPAKTNGDALEEESPRGSPENLIDRYLKNEDSLDGSDATIEDVLSTKAEASPVEKRLSPKDDFKVYPEEDVAEELMRIQQAAEAAVAGDRKASPPADKEEDKANVDTEKKTEDEKEDEKSEEAAEKKESEKTEEVKEGKEGSVSPRKEDEAAAQPEILQKTDSGDAAALSDDGASKAKSSQPAKPAEQRLIGSYSDEQKTRLNSIIDNLLSNKERQNTSEPKKTAATPKRDTPPAPTPPASAPSPSPSAASLPPPPRSETTPKSSKEAGSSSRKSGESRKRPSSPSRRESASSSRGAPGSAMSYMEHYATDMLAKRARYNYEVDHGDQHLSAAHKDFIERTKALSSIYPPEILNNPYFYHALTYPESYNMMLANPYAAAAAAAFSPQGRNTTNEKYAAMVSERLGRSAQRPDLDAARLHHAFSGVPTSAAAKAETSSSSAGKQSSSHSRKSASQSSASASATHSTSSSSQRGRDSGASSSTPSAPRPAHSNLKMTTSRDILGGDVASTLDAPPKAHSQKPTTNRAALMDVSPFASSKASPSPTRPSHSSSSASSAASPLSAMAARAGTPYMQMWQNCFPVPVQPPSSALEMNRLSQCFPALNGFLVPSAAGSGVSVKRSSGDPSNAVDLTQTKRRRHDDKGRSSTSRMSEAERRILSEVRMGAAGLGLTPTSAMLATMGGMEALAALPASLADRKSTPSPAHHTGSSHYSQARSSTSTASHSSSSSHSAKSSTVTSKSWSELDGGKTSSGGGECTCNRKYTDNMKYWSVNDVVRFVKSLDVCDSSADAFRQHNVDGRSLPLLTADHLTKTMGLKMGPALLLTEAVAQKARELSQVSPCDYCKRRSQHV